jgi:hypothetical protein
MAMAADWSLFLMLAKAMLAASGGIPHGAAALRAHNWRGGHVAAPADGRRAATLPAAATQHRWSPAPTTRTKKDRGEQEENFQVGMWSKYFNKR